MALARTPELPLRTGAKAGCKSARAILALAVGFLWGLCPSAAMSEPPPFEVGNSPGEFVDRPDVNPGDDDCADEDGFCTLRAAIEETNARANFDFITVHPGRYELTRGQLTITNNLILVGTEEGVIIDAGARNCEGGSSRVLAICKPGTQGCREVKGASHRDPEVHIWNLTLTGGNVKAPHRRGFFGGGGIAIGRDADVTLHSVQVSENCSDSSGGGILNHGRLLVGESTIARNRATGEDLPLMGTGGGIATIAGEAVTITDSLIAENRAWIGGGIAVFANPLQVRNSTISGNSAGLAGGGLFNGFNGHSNAPIWLNFVTITRNVVGQHVDTNHRHVYGGGGLYVEFPVVMTNSILADNIDTHDYWERPEDADRAPDCKTNGGALESWGNNIIGVPRLCRLYASSARHDQVGTVERPLNPQLAPLADNGGPTPTHAPRSGSPALNGVHHDTHFSLFGGFFDYQTHDQRRYRRPEAPFVDGNRLDVGAYEEGALP